MRAILVLKESSGANESDSPIVLVYSWMTAYTEVTLLLDRLAG
jgi:hypothetical protein